MQNLFKGEKQYELHNERYSGAERIVFSRHTGLFGDSCFAVSVQKAQKYLVEMYILGDILRLLCYSVEFNRNFHAAL